MGLLTRENKKKLKYFFIALIINTSFLYAYPIIEYLRSIKPEERVEISSVSIEKIEIQKPEEKKEKKKREPEKLRKNQVAKKNNRFEMKFGDVGGSGVALGSASQGVQGAVYKEGEVDVVAKAIRKVAPIYPVEAQSSGVRGLVILRIVISETGRVIEAIFESGEERYGFKESAIGAVRQWIFEPAKVNGLPVQFQFRVPFNFGR